MVVARGVCKKFARRLRHSLAYGARDIAAELLGRSRHSEALRPGESWALHEVGFELSRGEALGLVGPNGSGKTTLLRLISGLIKLDAGEIRVRGRVAPLLALGAGFSPVLTGRENVYVNMAILGVSHREIARRFDAVVEFAEIGEAMDAPVQTYSSGMLARLGFACAVHAEPEVLLIDEVLSVGDMRFRAKCYRRLAELRDAGAAFILVSHSPAAVLSIASRVLYLEHGRAVACGEPQSVIARYEDDQGAAWAVRADADADAAHRARLALPDTGAAIREVFLADGEGRRVAKLTTGEPAVLCVRLGATRPVADAGLSVLVRELVGDMSVLQNFSSHRDGARLSLQPGENLLQMRLPECNFRPGAYNAKVLLHSPTNYTYDALESFVFRVASEQPMAQSAFFQPREWHVASPPAEGTPGSGA